MKRLFTLVLLVTIALGCDPLFAEEKQPAAIAAEKKPAAAKQADDKPPTPLGEPIVIWGGPQPPALWIEQPMSDGSVRFQRAPRFAQTPCAEFVGELQRLQRTHGEPYTSAIDAGWKKDACARPAPPTGEAKP